MSINHLILENLQARFVEGSATPLSLSIRGLRLRLSREGFQTLVRTLLPEHPATIHIDSQSTRSACTLGVEVQQWGFSPRINVRLEPQKADTGSILINLSPGSRWSPTDQAMLAIATHKLESIARERLEIEQINPQSYRLDLQAVIRERLIESGAPVRWDARLEGIHANAEGIVFDFVQGM